MIRVILLSLVLIFSACKSTNTTPQQVLKNLGENPYYEVDGQPKNEENLLKIDSEDVALVSAYFGKEAKQLYGKKAKDGVVIIQTKKFATNKYETFFKSYSQDYEQMLSVIDSKDIQYVLNDNVLTEDFEGSLTLLNNELLKELKVINQETLSEKYDINDKKIGVILVADTPKDLYKSK